MPTDEATCPVLHDFDAHRATCQSRDEGMPLVNAFIDPNVPATGAPDPFLHFFHQVQDGSTIAWFESPELPAPALPSHPAYDTFNPLALTADFIEAVDAWVPWLHHHEIATTGPVRHSGITYSLYFYDPANQIPLDLSHPLDPPRW